MIPRTIRMAAEVASTFTVPQLEDYGNIILNGYLESVPNTINKKAWQYKETATAPVNLPSLTQITPALKGWTNNYQEYYTQLQPNDYDVDPGDPTMFEYDVHSFSQPAGGISTFRLTAGGSLYTPGTYLAEPLSGGSGVGATANIVVTAAPDVTKGPAISASFLSAGTGYPFGTVLFANRPTAALTGAGVGMQINGRSNAGVLVSIAGVGQTGGQDYEVGDIVQVYPGTGTATVTAVGYGGTVTSITVVNPGTGYKVNDALTAYGLPDGSNFYASVAEIVPGTGPYGEPNWVQAPRRLINADVAPFAPPNINQQAIQYSAILYPVSDNPLPPPVDTL